MKIKLKVKEDVEREFEFEFKPWDIVVSKSWKVFRIKFWFITDWSFVRQGEILYVWEWYEDTTFSQSNLTKYEE